MLKIDTIYTDKREYYKNKPKAFMRFSYIIRRKEKGLYAVQTFIANTKDGYRFRITDDFQGSLGECRKYLKRVLIR